jgi:hypothetical protein
MWLTDSLIKLLSHSLVTFSRALSICGGSSSSERKEKKKRRGREENEVKVDTFQNIKYLPLSLTLTANTILIGNSLLNSFKEW